MLTAEFFPWQTETAGRWLSQRDRLSHAWIFYGLEGIGKFQFAYATAASILCESHDSPFACGKCASCHWIAKHNHPDLRILVPEQLEELYGLQQTPEASSSKSKNPSKVIRVNQLRDLIHEQFFSMSSYRGGYKVVIIFPAETLNDEAANTLLKVLEEPQGETLFLLVSHSYSKVLPTILSRCQRLQLPAPAHDTASAWLQKQGVDNPDRWLAMAGGAPLRALDISQSEFEPVSYWLQAFATDLASGRAPNLNELVTRLEKVPPDRWMLSLQSLVLDIQLCQNGLTCRYFPSLAESMTRIAQSVKSDKLTELLRRLNKEQQLTQHPFNSKLYIQTTLQYVMVVLLVRR